MKTIRIERLNPAFCALLLSPLVAAADDPPVLAAPSDVRDLLRDAQEARLPATNASTQDLGSVSVSPADAASAAWFSAVGDGEAFAFEDPATSDTVLTNPASGGASRLAAEPDYDPNGLFLDAGYDPEENADLLPFYDPSLVTVRLWMSSEPSSDNGEGSPESGGDDGAGSGEGASGDEDDSAGSDQAGPVRGGPDRSGSPYPGYAPRLLASYYEFPTALSAVPDFTDLVPDFEQVEDTFIANEQIDYSYWEYWREKYLGIGQSVGIAQITIQTAITYGLTDCKLEDFHDYTDYHAQGSYIVTAEKQFRECVRNKLLADESNIEATAHLISIYMRKLCEKMEQNDVSLLFQMLSGLKKHSVCCMDGDCGKQNASPDLISAMAGLWNNGLGILSIEDETLIKNGPIHMRNAFLFGNAFEGICN